MNLWERLGGSNAQRALLLATFAALALGLYLRVHLFAIAPSTLWEDEAYWAWKTLTLPVLTQTFRPPGFLLLTKGLITWLGPSELTFRALPFLASLVGLLASPYVAQQLFRSGLTRLVVVLLMATHPAALTMGVEFKQYGVELGVFVALLAAYLWHRARPSPKRLALVLGLSWAAFFFSIIIVFLYPALFAVLAWDALKSRRLRVVGVVIGTAILCVATIVTIYFTTWRHLDGARAEKKWGNKYGVFYVANEQQGRVAWTAGKYVDLATIPGFGRGRWNTEVVRESTLEALASADQYFWLGLHGLGISWLVYRRRFRELAWLWSPLLVLLLFSVAGRWPAGAFRTNAGYVPYAIFLSAYGLEALAELKFRLGQLLLPVACVLAWGPTAIFRPDWFQKGTFASAGNFDAALEVLAESPASRGRRPVLMDNSSCRPWKYYTQYDTRLARTLAPRIRQRFQGRCIGGTGRLAAQLTKILVGGDVWVLLTNRKQYKSADVATRKACGSVKRIEVAGGRHVLWHCEPKPKRK